MATEEITPDRKKLKSDLDKGIRQLTKYRRGNKNKATWVAILISSFAAATTVFIGIAQFDIAIYWLPTTAQILALVLSFCATVLLACPH